tara:strand:+ start:725 stop:943 length:219 start_codon:yes stop_codon:yes gene_type:complete
VKVIEGFFDGITVPQVFDAILETENLEDYTNAFCFIKSEDYVVISSNMEPQDLYFLLDQIKMTLLTNGEYEV